MTQVLIVDDERSLRRTLSFVFGRAGCEVREAADGVEALDRLREAPADLIVLDVMMPNKTGFETLAELRADPDLHQSRVIIITAKGQPEDRDKAMELGADAFMTKPFSPTEVFRRAEELLSSEPHPSPQA